VLDSVTIEDHLYSVWRILLEKYIGRVRNHPLNRSGRYTAVRVMVDKQKWESYSNRGPPRVQSPAKQAEI
jgi:hypothetical protein